MSQLAASPSNNLNKLRCARPLLLRALLLRAFLACCFALGMLTEATSAEGQWQGVERIVAIGDVHGEYTNFLALLREAELVNRRGNWIAGTTHLVQLGDIPDRGPDTDKVIKLLKQLEIQAEKAGGKVHVLIGNHEAMNMLGDLRYVDPGELAALRTRDSRRLRDAFYEQEVARRVAADPEFVADEIFRKQWEKEVPLGLIEHRRAWGPTGDFGAWVLQHNAVIRINRNLFLHAGISPQIVGMSATQINEQIRQELRNGLGTEPGLSEREDGPLWYRGLATNDETIELAHVDRVLAAYDVDRIIIGHTPGLATVVPRFAGKVLVVDAGLSAYYGRHRAALLLEKDQLETDQVTTLQRGSRVSVPQSTEGLLAYFQQIAELEPEVPALQERINSLQSQ